MTVKAKTKNIGISVKKLRPYVNLVRGKKAVEALDILSFMNSSSSETLIELIKSAIANAESSQYGSKEELIISTIYADKSTTKTKLLVFDYEKKFHLTPLKTAQNYL